MKKLKNIFSLLVVALVGLSLAACSNDDLGTNQYQGGVSLNAYGPNPVMRGGQLRFVGSNLDQIASITIPGVGEITNIEVVKSGVPSEIRITVPKDGPQVGYVTLKTKTDQTITTKTQIEYIEGIEVTQIPEETVMPGQTIRIEGDYLNLIYSMAFADGVLVSSDDFVAQDRYYIEVVVPEDAKTGKLEFYTADLTIQRTKEELNKLTYQTIVSEDALTVGLPTTSKLHSDRSGDVEVEGSITAKAGETITLTGDYYNVISAVKFGDVEVSDFEVSKDGTTLTFTLPAAAPDGVFSLVCKSGEEVPVATLTTIKPTNCTATPNPVKALKALTISGQDMDLVTGVKFEGADVVTGDNLNVSADKVVVALVPETATEGKLQLVMANGATVDVAFTLVKPVATAYNVNPASAGGTIQITGTDLDLVKSVTFGEAIAELEKDAVSADGTTLTVKVPMEGKSGKPKLNLANGTSVEAPELTIDEAVFCYAVALPGAEEELKAGNSMTITVANGDKLTGVQMNGTDCQWILTGEDKNQLIIGIPEDAKAKSVLKLISSNGEISYNIAVIPATSVKKTIWSGLKELTWNDGGRIAIPAATFEDVPAGAILTIAYTQVDQTWGDAQFNYGDWSGINFTEAGEGVVTFNKDLVPTDIYGWFKDGILNRETSMILTQDILDKIQTKKGGCEGQENCGIIIQGAALTVSKITLEWENPSEITIWEGNEDLSGGAQPYIGSDGGAEFIENNVKAGQTVRFYIEPTEEGWYYEVFEGHWGPKYAKYDASSGIAYGSKGAVELTLTQDMIDAALVKGGWGGIFVVQGKVILTKVTVE